MNESASQRNDDPEHSSIDVPLQMRELPAEVKAIREQMAEQDAVLAGIVQPRVEAQIAACRMVAKQLQVWHQGIADTTNLDLTGYSRGAATWLLAGRCLGLLEVLLVQAEAGIDNEALIVGRAAHEANRLLMAFCSDPDEDELVRLWLNDEGKHGYVKQGAARAANNRFEEKLNDAIKDQGMQPLGSTSALTAELYDRLSRTVHNRWSSCVSSVWEQGRQMAYGRAPNQLRRAGAVEWTTSVTIEVVQSVGDALRAFYGNDFLVKEVAPLLQSIAAVRASSPLDEVSIMGAAKESL
jgi:hypothetical protein